jgi:hypothetical protein
MLAYSPLSSFGIGIVRIVENAHVFEVVLAKVLLEVGPREPERLRYGLHQQISHSVHLLQPFQDVVFQSG